MRIPLYVKLMLSYLLVVGFVLIPTAVYLRTTLLRDQRAEAQRELEGELVAICARLADAPPEQLGERVGLLLTVLPARLTVVDPQGNVLGDSFRRGDALPNHAGRPEIRDALARGTGSAIRTSATTGQRLLYAAMRFPRSGAPARGVARLARPLGAVDAATANLSDVMRDTGAAALSAAVLLSLVAAIAASRPLRRIAVGARALAAGDFGHRVEVSANDEIGEVAHAISDLGAQLREKLVASGAEHATLHALLDGLPVGVVLFDAHRWPLAVNGAARVLCHLEPHDEDARAADLAKLPAQREAIERVLRDGVTQATTLRLPWREQVELDARWVAVFDQVGARRVALVVASREAEARARELEGAVRETAASLRAAAARANAAAAPRRDEHAADLLRRADELEALVPARAPESDQVRPVSLGELAAQAVASVPARAGDGGAVRFELSFRDDSVRVAEVDSRARRALSELLAWGARGARAGDTVTLREEVGDAEVRLTVQAAAWPAFEPARVEPLVEPLGGHVGGATRGELAEWWLALPRA